MNAVRWLDEHGVAHEAEPFMAGDRIARCMRDYILPLHADETTVDAPRVTCLWCITKTRRTHAPPGD